MNIAIVGMPFAYKTTVAKLLAKRFNMRSFDTDEYIQFQKGMSVSEIFSKYGEKTFRKMEADALAMAVDFEDAVISCGGGAVTVKRNIKSLKKCYVIYLYVTPNTVYNRSLKHKDRPLLVNADLAKVEQIYLSRKEAYKLVADLTLNCNRRTSQTITDEIVVKLQQICNG